MKRLLLSSLFLICYLSFGFAQQSAYQMAGPYEVVARDGQYRNTKAGSERDMWQAWQRAQQGDEATALAIINAYAQTLQRFDGHDAPLCTIQAYWLLRAMNLMKGKIENGKLKTDSLSVEANVQSSMFNLQSWAAMVRRAILPVLDKYEADSPYANGNWGHIVNRCRMAAAIFLDDEALYQHAVDIYLHANDNGSLPNYISATGQCQETGRDQGHAQLGLGAMCEICEMAWQQGERQRVGGHCPGIDLWGALDNRLMKGMEYTARYNLGYDVPFETWTDCTGLYNDWTEPGEMGRGNIRCIYDLPYQHYVGRKGLKMPYTKKLLALQAKAEQRGEIKRNPEADQFKVAGVKEGVKLHSIYTYPAPAGAPLKHDYDVYIQPRGQKEWTKIDTYKVPLPAPPRGGAVTSALETIEAPSGAVGGAAQAPAEGYDKRKYSAMDIIVRAYDEGVAFRYHFPETANSLFLHITGEQTSFAFPQGTQAWYEEWAQGPYELRSLSEKVKVNSEEFATAASKAWFESERPLLLQLADGTYVALLEAAMRDYTRGKFRLAKDNVLQVALYDCADIISPYDTPWRVIMAGERAVDLINHKDLILNLAPPSPPEGGTIDLPFDSKTIEAPSGAVGGASWIRPGKAFRSGRLDKASIFRSIDYCKEFGFDYVELDAGWYGPEGKVASDARKVIETRDFTMPEVCAYAKSKGIGVWVYVNQRALYQQIDELLPLYQQWGISGIKFGFVHIGNQQWSTWLHDAVEKCAKYQLMVDIHDEYRPTGLSRTYPNLLTQEGIRGNEEMPDATHNTLLPFTRYLCGPADYTLCYFNSRVKNTKGHQLAMAAVYYSPLQFYFWYDSPFVDKGEQELQFWKDCPTTFDESIALDGIPGEYIIQARRAGKDWFVGCMTNTEGRTVTVPTDFLVGDASKRRSSERYQVTIYNDDPTLNTRTKVRTSTKSIKAGTPIQLQLQPSGGATLHFTPASK